MGPSLRCGDGYSMKRMRPWRAWRTVCSRTDWRSLTLTGERLRLDLRIPGPGAAAIAQCLTFDLADAEFSVPGQIVADIGVEGAMVEHPDGAISLTIEALTIEE